jgi:hypothetical protein
MTDLRLWLRIPLVLLMLATGAVLAGCDEEGPAEKAGAKIDEATQDVQKAVGEAAKDVQGAADEAAKDVTGTTDSNN